MVASTISSLLRVVSCGWLDHSMAVHPKRNSQKPFRFLFPLSLSRPLPLSSSLASLGCPGSSGLPCCWDKGEIKGGMCPNFSSLSMGVNLRLSVNTSTSVISKSFMGYVSSCGIEERGEGKGVRYRVALQQERNVGVLYIFVYLAQDSYSLAVSTLKSPCLVESPWCPLCIDKLTVLATVNRE